LVTMKDLQSYLKKLFNPKKAWFIKDYLV
jgi:hypothetical protein